MYGHKGLACIEIATPPPSKNHKEVDGGGGGGGGIDLCYLFEVHVHNYKLHRRGPAVWMVSSSVLLHDVCMHVA